MNVFQMRPPQNVLLHLHMSRLLLAPRRPDFPSAFQHDCSEQLLTLLHRTNQLFTSRKQDGVQLGIILTID